MKKTDNFFRALQNLKEIDRYDPPKGNVEIAGLVALYEICFEQAWKAMKELLEASGFADTRTGSPKMVIKTAFQAHMISNEEVWIRALRDRNNVAHSYNEDIALAIIQHAREDYVPMFEDLREKMKRDWLPEYEGRR